MLRLGAQVKVFGGEATGKVFNFQELVEYTRHRIDCKYKCRDRKQTKVNYSDAIKELPGRVAQTKHTLMFSFFLALVKVFF